VNGVAAGTTWGNLTNLTVDTEYSWQVRPYDGGPFVECSTDDPSLWSPCAIVKVLKHIDPPTPTRECNQEIIENWTATSNPFIFYVEMGKTSGNFKLQYNGAGLIPDYVKITY